MIEDLVLELIKKEVEKRFPNIEKGELFDRSEFCALLPINGGDPDISDDCSYAGATYSVNEDGEMTIYYDGSTIYSNGIWARRIKDTHRGTNKHRPITAFVAHSSIDELDVPDFIKALLIEARKLKYNDGAAGTEQEN
jgi:hypothetical protein